MQLPRSCSGHCLTTRPTERSFLQSDLYAQLASSSASAFHSFLLVFIWAFWKCVRMYRCWGGGASGVTKQSAVQGTTWTMRNGLAQNVRCVPYLPLPSHHPHCTTATKLPKQGPLLPRLPAYRAVGHLQVLEEQFSYCSSWLFGSWFSAWLSHRQPTVWVCFCLTPQIAVAQTKQNLWERSNSDANCLFILIVMSRSEWVFVGEFLQLEDDHLLHFMADLCLWGERSKFIWR